MLLSLRDAALLLERPTRTLRSQLARGEIKGIKRDNRWWVPREALPLSESRLASVLQQADVIRAAVDGALPSRTGAKKPRSVADFEPFRVAREVLVELEMGSDAHASLGRALRALAAAVHRYTPAAKHEALAAARDALAEAVAELLIFPGIDDPATASRVRRLEASALSPLGGLIRWAERAS